MTASALGCVISCVIGAMSFLRIVGQLGEQQRVDGERPADADADGRAVGRGLGDRVGADDCRWRPACSRRRKRWPDISCCSSSAISRATMSGVEPAPNGTMIFTVLGGQSAPARRARRRTIEAPSNKRPKFSFAFPHLRARRARDRRRLSASSLLQPLDRNIGAAGIAGKRKMRRGSGGLAHDETAAATRAPPTGPHASSRRSGRRPADCRNLCGTSMR